MPSLITLRRSIVAAAAFIAVSHSTAAASPFAKGPDPTPQVLAQPTGPYAVTASKIPDSASPAFRAATIFAPIAPAGQTFGVVAVSPGFLAEEWTLTWLAQRVASQGFVTIVFTPNDITSSPVVRSRALQAALRYVTTKSAEKPLADPDRLAVVGHSMGGGGALEAARRDPTLKAVVAIAPWSRWTNFAQVQSPTLVLGFTPDNIAPIAKHATPFYRSLSASLPKAYLEMDFQHATPSLWPVTDVSRATTSWLKRFLDDDERYTPAVCPIMASVTPAKITGYQSTCGAGPLLTSQG
jgi:hypothetical protein